MTLSRDLPARDLRDPTAVGEMHAMLRQQFPDTPAHVLADNELMQHVRPYPKDHSLVQETMADYREKMREQAEEGILAARRVCVEHGWYDEQDEWAPALVAEQERQAELQASGVEVDPDVEPREGP